MSSVTANATGGTDNCEDCCIVCCCYGCTFCGHLFCCGKMKKTTRVQILWGWIFVLVIATGVFLGVVQFGEDSITASPSDMRSVVNNVDFLFCDSVYIQSSGLSFDTYVVNGHPAIDEGVREIYNATTTVFVDVDSFSYFSFYLLAGSRLTLYNCPQTMVTYYLIKGQDNFKSWQKDNDCCYMDQSYIFGDSCDNIYEYISYQYNITENDDYYVVFTSQISGGWVNSKFFLNRTVYDLDHALQSCSDVIYCEVAWDNVDQTIVFNVKDYYDLQTYPHEAFQTKCVPRLWVYVVFLGFGSIFVGAILTILILKLCKDPRPETPRHANRDFSVNERSPLLWNVHPPSYSDATLAPPKYEDIVRDDGDKDLPTYAQATNQTTTAS